MHAKATVRGLLDRLPDECTLEEVLYHLYVIAGVEQGTRELNEGHEIPHEKVEQDQRQPWRVGVESSGPPQLKAPAAGP